MKKTSHLIYQNGALILAVVGLLFIVVAFALSRLFAGTAGVNLLELAITSLANIGGLILIVGILQWMFDQQMREEMIHEISRIVLSNERIRQNGITDCYQNSLNFDNHLSEHLEQWKKAERLIIGAHYAEAFFSNYISLFEERCKAECSTVVLISNPDSLGIKYLKDSDPEVPNVEERVQRIIRLLTSPPHGCTTQMHIYLHPVVLRYLFIATEDSIWFVPMLNSKGRSQVPAIQIRHDSPLYTIFYDDIQRLIQQAVPHVSTT